MRRTPTLPETPFSHPATSKDELLKGKLKLEHSLGLGKWPNAVPAADPDITGPQRPVMLGWHPVAGFAGKWFAEKTGLGKLITEKTHRCPDPTQHWAVLVGEYAHELWMVGFPSRLSG